MKKPFEQGWYRKTEWVTRDGRVLAVKEMEDDHVQRVIQMLDRAAPVLKDRVDWEYAFESGPQGDMASLAWAVEQDQQLNKSAHEWLESTELYSSLKTEARRRGFPGVKH